MTAPETIQVETPKPEIPTIEISAEKEVVAEPKTTISETNTTPLQPKVSALSLSSIRAKRELEKNNRAAEKQRNHAGCSSGSSFFPEYASRSGQKND